VCNQKIRVRSFEPGDWPAVLNIYLEGIATGHATFETVAPSWEKWDSNHLSIARLVAATEDDTVAGWAALSPVSSRAVYSGVAEVSVYVGVNFRGLGIGASLLGELIRASETNDIWTLQASVFPENVASVILHRKHGFRDVGVRKHIARLNGAWRNTLLLERRSNIIGVE
jgi:L-amino acid N-acyltransferase YncA